MIGIRYRVHSWCRISIALACLSLGPLTANAEEAKNVRVTVEIGKLEGGKTASTNSFVLVTAGNGSTAQLSSGSRVPIQMPVADPGDTAGTKTGAGSPTYQNIGVSMTLETLVEGEHVHVKGSIDLSLIDGSLDVGVASQRHSSPPSIIGTLDAQVDVVLHAGKPLRVRTIPTQGGAAIFIDLKAEILD